MLNFQDFKNVSTIGDKLILLVDEVNDSHSFGFTDSISKVTYNLQMLDAILQKAGLEKTLANSTEGLTTLFPLGRYIMILKIKKDKSAMNMCGAHHDRDLNAATNIKNEGLKKQLGMSLPEVTLTECNVLAPRGSKKKRKMISNTLT